MEIRPDRFKVVAAKTLGKIYGYVKSLWDEWQPEKKGEWQGRNWLLVLKIKSSPFAVN